MHLGLAKYDVVRSKRVCAGAQSTCVDLSVNPIIHWASLFARKQKKQNAFRFLRRIVLLNNRVAEFLFSLRVARTIHVVEKLI